MSDKIAKLTSDLKASLYRHTYRVEVDTEDYVLGFKNTIKKSTKDYSKSLRLRAKTMHDLGRFLSETVRIVEVRWYADNELIKTMTAEPY